METVVFVLFWFGGVPLAALRIAGDLAEEKIFEKPLAMIEAKFHGTLIGYLIRCPLCLAHWVVVGFALGFWESWASLPLPPWSRPVAAVIGIFAAIEITNRIRK